VTEPSGEGDGPGPAILGGHAQARTGSSPPRCALVPAREVRERADSLGQRDALSTGPGVARQRAVGRAGAEFGRACSSIR
jgi:hypothetical protein